MGLVKTRPKYYDVDSFGVPINDQDSIATISTFSGQLIWFALPAQGIFMKDKEAVDYIALWRLVAWYMGTPTDIFESVEVTKAYMESTLMVDLTPTSSSKVLAGNIITALAHQPPTYASADYLSSLARWLNGPRLSDALDIPKSSIMSTTLVAVQLFVVGVSNYIIREIPVLDRWKINWIRNRFYNVFILGKDGLKGNKTRFELQYMPGYDVTTEKGETKKGLALGNLASTDTHNFIMLLALLGMGSGSMYLGAKIFFTVLAKVA